MAQTHSPYRFHVCGLDFDITFIQTLVALEYGKHNAQMVTVAFARRPKDIETLAAKAIRNPSDERNLIIGQRVAFKRLMDVIYNNWIEDDFKYTRKEFIDKARQIAFCVGMWDVEE